MRQQESPWTEKETAILNEYIGLLKPNQKVDIKLLLSKLYDEREKGEALRSRNAIESKVRRLRNKHGKKNASQLASVPKKLLDSSPRAVLLTKLLSLVKKGPQSVESLCNILDLSPNKTRALINEALESGYTVRVADDGLVHPAGWAPRAEQTTLMVPKIVSTLRWAVFSDLHFGSRYCLEEEISDFVEYVYDREGINLILGCGDNLDGHRVYRGQEFELQHHGYIQQRDRMLDVLPSFPNLKYAFIDGNHDASLWKLSGLVPGHTTQQVAESQGRYDLVYLGPDQAQILLCDQNQPDAGGLLIEVAHPDKAGAYARSYHIQKYVEALQVGSEPQILFTGHEHDYIQVEVGGIYCVKACTFQSQTPYMARKNLEPALGGLIVEVKVTEDFHIREWSCRKISYDAPRLKKKVSLPVRQVFF